MISRELPVINLFRKRFNNVSLHWLCCIFLSLYILANQYSYAKSDRLFVVDHDMQFCSDLFERYNQNPAGYIKSLFKDMIFQRPCFPSGATFLNLRLAIEFYLFGRTPFVYKMDAAYFLIILCLAVYFLVYNLTARETLGFISSLVLLNFPDIVNFSRKQFEFIPVTAICTLALFFLIKDLRLEKRLYCALFLICLLLGPIIHLSSLFYFAFFLFYLAFTKKNTLHYVVLTVCLVLIIVWSYPNFVLWMKNKYVSNGLAASFCGFIAYNFSRVGNKLSDMFRFYDDRRLLYVFIANVFFLFCLYGLNKLKYKNRIPRIDSRQKLVLIFIGYVVILFLASDSFIGCFTILYVLCVVSFFALLSFIEDAFPRLRMLLQIYVILCSVFVFYQFVYKTGQRYFQPRLVVPISTMAQKERQPYGDLMTRLNIYPDMSDISGIFPILANENKLGTGTSNLHILSSSVILYYKGEKATIGRSYPFLIFNGDFDDARWLYSPQAFYSGVPVQWRYIFMHLSPNDFDDLLPNTFASAPNWGEDPRKWYAKQMEENSLSQYKYMFLTVLADSDAPAQAWQMPSIQAVLEKIKEANSILYNKFFSNMSLITKCRMHKNLFLYVFRINNGAITK